MLSRLLVIAVVVVFGLAMFLAGILAPENYRERTRSWVENLFGGVHHTAGEASGSQSSDSEAGTEDGEQPK